MSAHPLAGMLARAARGSYPSFDGRVEVLPSPGPPVDALLVSIADGSGAPPWLHRDDGFAHPRVDEAAHFRTVESVWTDDIGSLLIIGRGLCGRTEVGYEVAPGNAASMRSTLAAGFDPVGAEVLFAPGSDVPY